VGTAPVFASPQEALAVLRSALGYLAGADVTAMPAGTRAEALRGLEQAGAMVTAARAFILGAFTTERGYQADAAYSPRSWLVHQTGVTKGAASGHTAWVRRAEAHPRIARVMALGVLSESVARMVCGWVDKLPEDCRDAAGEILADAAEIGADLADLAEITAKIYAKVMPASGETQDEDFTDGWVRLETTFEGAGVLRGDLTAECAAAVAAVLEALSAPAGAEDTRSEAQRRHDGLQDAMQRLLASGLLPGRAGQPARVMAHIALGDLMVLEGSSALLAEWTERVRGQWAAARAGASIGGGDGAAWLEGQAAEAFACDASVTPVVTGEVNYQALEGLVGLCVELARLDRAGDGDPAAPPPPDAPGSGLSRDALERAVIGKAVELLSGPGGLASLLRTQQLGARLAGPSLPLDIGFSKDIPAGIRNAVLLRDRRCRWPGGCRQPAAACQVHHVKHKADGGTTSVGTCVLLCFFHHQVCIHRWGWTLVLNPDGTTTAWNPGRTKVLRSHGPPARPG
jgi:hypothetical protein